MFSYQQCGGCPHIYHPITVCGTPVEGLQIIHNYGKRSEYGSIACPCSYDMDEEPADRLPIDDGKGLYDLARGANR